VGWGKNGVGGGWYFIPGNAGYSASNKYKPEEKSPLRRGEVRKCTKVCMVAVGPFTLVFFVVVFAIIVVVAVVIVIVDVKLEKRERQPN
jgi:Flp pilus assembly protein TadB